MAVSPFDSAIYRDLYRDAEVGELFTDSAEIRAMLLFEGALAAAQGRLGIIPEISAKAIERAAREVIIDPASLAAGTAEAGVVAPALVPAFRAAMQAPEHAQYIHWGATSQDVVDTGLVLRLRRFLHIMDERLARLIARLAEQAKANRDVVMAARTRSQIATPTTFGAKIAVWASMLIRCRARLRDLRPRLLFLSLAGASGTLAAMEGRGLEVADAVAKDLNLAAPSVPWHSARDGIAELASALAILAGALGKIGQDLVLLMQSEVREVRAGAGGGSSTMPHKSNPVGPEVLLTLARISRDGAGITLEAMIHAQEREGAAWALEWHALPQVCMAAAAATAHAWRLAETLEPDPARMRAAIEATNGMMLAEAAAFALARHMPRPEAQALVKDACKRAASGGRHLREVLSAATDAPLDWDAVFDALNYVGEARQIVDRLLAEASED